MDSIAIAVRVLRFHVVSKTRSLSRVSCCHSSTHLGHCDAALPLPQVSIAPMVAYDTTFSIATSIPISLLWVQAITMIGNSWNGVLWTVSAFAVCYVAFCPLVTRLRVLPDPALWKLAVVLCTGSTLLASVWIGADWPLAGVLHIWAPFRLPQFTVGMCTGLLSRRHPVCRPTLVAEACSAVLLGSMVACGLVTHAYGPGAWFRYMLVAEFALLPVHALWLAALATPGCAGPTRAVLASRALRLLGSVSYALYCLHLPTLNFLAWAIAGHRLTASAVPQHDRDRHIKMGRKSSITGWFADLGGGDHAGGVSSLWPAVSTCLVVAVAAFLLVEEPSRRALNAWGARQRQQRLPPTSAPDTITAGREDEVLLITAVNT